LLPYLISSIVHLWIVRSNTHVPVLAMVLCGNPILSCKAASKKFPQEVRK
jgi:hypothetical protein